MPQPAKSQSADILAPKLVLIITTLILVLLGLVMVFSASSVEAINNSESPYIYLIKQAAFCLVGLVCAGIIWRRVSLNFWKGNVVWVIAGILFFCMLLTLIAGTDILGARRWIYIGGFSFQPSEFAKIIIVLVVSKLYYEFVENRIELKKFLLTLVLTVGIMLAFILFAQSDLGTTIICCVGILSVLWLGGCPKRILIILLIVGACAAVFLIITTGYRSNRMVFLDPYNDGANGYGAGYQTIRSRYAFAEGGFFGVGLGNSYEKYQYLPEAETDFIFAIIGEELGMLGALFTVLLFVVFLISGLLVAKNCATGYGAAIAGAFVIMIVFQAFLNILCVIGFAPTTGKPLPFISAGGSSLIATLVMVGIILQASEELASPEKKREEFKVVKEEKPIPKVNKVNNNIATPAFLNNKPKPRRRR